MQQVREGTSYTLLFVAHLLQSTKCMHDLHHHHGLRKIGGVNVRTHGCGIAAAL